ncbi:glycerophosphodiester phosphodiesterase family protein [Erythrobacter litoralis]|uniref:glycerophosphodiester phosphodiesterase n=1 Tax=Erythrobacter litoralis (strain HTCC2594) TaxID=314225 RepID=Q2N5P3_ERYLH|nr:glycerophosphoryl diester phosphodiesterase [Erythrobacter litoralis HTCC2594]
MLRFCAAALLTLLATPGMALDEDFLVIAHRGASGERPEHTLAAYERAIDQGADYIEPDLVLTRDGVFVARHENEIGQTTDVASRTEFADKRTTKSIDGVAVTGWFAEDFTLAELRTLRAKERIPAIRPANARFDGLYPVPTLEDIVRLVRAKEAETGRRIGLYPELKHPSFLQRATGINPADHLVRELERLEITPQDLVFIQSFETWVLGRLDRLSEFKLVQLIKPDGGPVDEPGVTYAEMVTPDGLAEVATYADGVGVNLALVLQADGSPTSLVSDAAQAGLVVHAWTVRKQNAFLPPGLREGEDGAAVGNYAALLAMLESAGVDGVFTDDVLPTICALGDEANNDDLWCALLSRDQARLPMPRAEDVVE